MARTDGVALYLDSSAIVKLLVEEPETDVLRQALDQRALISSELALTEVPRAVRGALRRERDRQRSAQVSLGGVLGRITFVPVGRDLLIEAGALPYPGLRALDAIHVASALAVATLVEAIVTYDHRQQNVAREIHLKVLAPA